MRPRFVISFIAMIAIQIMLGGLLNLTQYLVISILTSIFNIGSTLWTIIAFSSMGAFILAGLVYYIVKTLQNKTVKADTQ